jgi:hypothetical protein
MTTGSILRTTLRPAGLVADLSREITGGRGTFMGASTSENLSGTGYVQHEYFAVGTAT